MEATIKTDSTGKEVLVALNAWFEAGQNGSWAQDEERKALWHVLTAMRGPDSDDQLLKTRTTKVLREAALPGARGFGPMVADGQALQHEATQNVQLATAMEGVSRHFAHHVLWAAEDLQSWGLLK